MDLSYGSYISQLLRYYARVCSDVIDFNKRNQCITGKLSSYYFVTINYLKLLLNSFIDTSTYTNIFLLLVVFGF